MCGIAGFIDLSRATEAAESTLREMLARIAHRGPDDSGTWLHDGVAIGHLRLAIVDTSPSGHQPMLSTSGRYVLAFNGEIYNHASLRNELVARGAVFKGHSDTEVLLALIEEQGLAAALTRCVGMFAIALWDRQQRRLALARDRFGEKPIYYTRQHNSFLFASELKALAAHPSFERRLNLHAVAQLMRFGYIAAPHSIYENVHKLEPAAILQLDIDAASAAPTFHHYWRAEDAFAQGLAKPFEGSFEDAVGALDTLLRNAVKGQMQADVPLGAMLSGGIDSSTIVALMQAQSATPIRTYCIGFDSPASDEAPHARAVAQHLQTLHTELYVSSAHARAVIPQLPTLYDEPLGDSSQIPTFLLAGLVRRDLTVALSGDGGDEVFGGYPKYLVGRRYAGLPGRHAFAALLAAVPWRAAQALSAPLPRPIASRLVAQRLRLRHALLSARGPTDIAEVLARVSQDDLDIVPGARRLETVFSAPAPLAQGRQPDYVRAAMLLDQRAYLPGDILAKVDRATMANSLESRAPLLDHRVAELAASLPTEYLVGAGQSKRVLRELLYRYVPRALVERPKQGFSAPLADWLRSDLHDWAADLIHGSKGSPSLNRPFCARLLAEHRAAQADHSGVLWCVLSFLAWADAWL